MTHRDPRLLHHRIHFMRQKYPGLAPLAETMTTDSDESHQWWFDLILDVLENDHRVERAEHGALFSQMIDVIGARHRAETLLHDTILVNALGLLALGRTRDYRDLVWCIETAGHEVVAGLHHQIDPMTQTAPELPWTTELVLRLSTPQPPANGSANGSEHSDLTSEERAVCVQAAVELLLQDIDAAALTPVDPILTEGGLVYLVDSGDARQWRRHLGAVAAHPWGEHARGLGDLGQHPPEDLDRPGVAVVLSQGTQQLRAAVELEERRVIADRVHALVQHSGLSQRAFAARIGTSASRMSTYVNGQVTPSAALLLRMTRAAVAARGDSEGLDFLS